MNSKNLIYAMANASAYEIRAHYIQYYNNHEFSVTQGMILIIINYHPHIYKNNLIIFKE